MNDKFKLVKSVRNGYLEIVRALLNSGANANDQDASGSSALMWAMKEGNLEVVNVY